MSDNIEISVGSDEAAACLRSDFMDLTMRVNMDLSAQRWDPSDPASVERTIAQAERSVDHHLTAFPHNDALQSLAAEIKNRFRIGLEAQART